MQYVTIADNRNSLITLNFLYNQYQMTHIYTYIIVNYFTFFNFNFTLQYYRSQNACLLKGTWLRHSFFWITDGWAIFTFLWEPASEKSFNNKSNSIWPWPYQVCIFLWVLMEVFLFSVMNKNYTNDNLLLLTEFYYCWWKHELPS